MEQDLKEKVQNQAEKWAAAKKSSARKICENLAMARATAGNHPEAREEENVRGVDQRATNCSYRP